MIDITERARRCIAKMRPSVQGSDGSRAAMSCMMVLIKGFALSDNDARALFCEWNGTHCEPAWNEREIDRLVANANKRESDKPIGYMLNENGTGRAGQDYVVSRNQGVPPAPQAPREETIPKFDPAKLQRVIAPMPEIGRDYFRERSPLEVSQVSPGGFLEAIYDEGQRVLIFTNFRSQGDFLWEVGRGGYRLSQKAGVKAVRSELPSDGGSDGVWFLNQPVSGKWMQDPYHKTKTSRRSTRNVSAWRYVVLESDDANESEWLRLLALLPLPIVALYSSGGRSIHALVRIDCATVEEMNTHLKQDFKRVLCALGADPGALTSVRLTRLPGCTRKGNLQELIYLDPDALVSPFDKICNRPPVR